MALVRDGVHVRAIDAGTYDIIVGDGTGKSFALDRFISRIKRRGCRVQRTGCGSAVRLFTFAPADDPEAACAQIRSMVERA